MVLGQNGHARMMPNLHAIPEAEVEDFALHRQAEEEADDSLSSGGSLSEPRSDPRSLKAAGREGVRAGEDDVSRIGFPALLTTLEAERSKMSKTVLASADGLSAAVALARKRLAANIAAVDEQLREERLLLEENRSMNRSISVGIVPLSPITGDSTPTSLAELESTMELLKAQVRTAEHERDAYKDQLDGARRELSDQWRRWAQVSEHNAALEAEVRALRGRLEQAGLLPPSDGSFNSGAGNDSDAATEWQGREQRTEHASVLQPLSSVATPMSSSASAAPHDTERSTRQAPSAMTHQPPAPSAVSRPGTADTPPPPALAPPGALPPPAAGPPAAAMRPSQASSSFSSTASQLGAAESGGSVGGGRQGAVGAGGGRGGDVRGGVGDGRGAGGDGRQGMAGVLRRKKADHSMFEDPWRGRLQCVVVGAALECTPIVAPDSRSPSPATERSVPFWPPIASSACPLLSSPALVCPSGGVSPPLAYPCLASPSLASPLLSLRGPLASPRLPLRAPLASPPPPPASPRFSCAALQRA